MKATSRSLEKHRSGAVLTRLRPFALTIFRLHPRRRFLESACAVSRYTLTRHDTQSRVSPCQHSGACFCPPGLLAAAYAARQSNEAWRKTHAFGRVSQGNEHDESY